MTHDYTTHDGEPVPEKVREKCAPPEEWDGDRVYTSPDNVATPVTAGETELYHIVNKDGEQHFVDDSGHTYGLEQDHVPLGGTYHDTEYSLNPNITHVHRDTKAEHVTSVSVATPDGVFSHYSRSGIAWTFVYATRLGIHPDDLTDEMVHVAESLADAPAQYKPDRPDGWEHVSGGWHSSMERSQLSDKINSITSGDAHDALGWDFPVVVKFGDTRNVCSVNMDVYAPTEHVQTVKEELSGTRAKPGHAGLAD